jgi:hypothetical protein
MYEGKIESGDCEILSIGKGKGHAFTVLQQAWKQGKVRGVEKDRGRTGIHT